MDGWVQGAVETVGRKGMYQPPSSKRRRMQKVLFFFFFCFVVVVFSLSHSLSHCFCIFSSSSFHHLLQTDCQYCLQLSFMKRKEKEDVFYFQGV